jgi:hypothetical protein
MQYKSCHDLSASKIQRRKRWNDEKCTLFIPAVFLSSANITFDVI